MNKIENGRASALMLWCLVVIVLVLAAGFALAWRPAIEPIKLPARESFDRRLVQRGARLSAVGDCATCHTSNDASPYAGGLALGTPFGTIYSTNITPDPKTGIGTWSDQAFRRAMREGISRDGHHLYPAFPYDHYTHVADDEITALYAFMMTRDPIEAPARQNDLKFPFGFRPLVAGWNLLYLDKSPFRPDPSQSAEWNRGAYLVQSLGHCGACHSPRNALGAEDKRQYLGGGEAEGWYVPALNARSLSPLPWTVEQLTAYLGTGLARDHAIAAGPMQGVVNSVSNADEKDVQAIAIYIKSVLGTPSPEQQARARSAVQRAALGSLAAVRPTTPPSTSKDEENLMALGETVYAGACAGCHDAGRQDSSGGALPLPLAIAVYEPDLRNLVHIIREGIYPPSGQRGRWMPGFADPLTDEQLIALVSYVRRYAADAPPWADIAESIQKAKSP
jgi:mono/diheme cytochrome c family protein